MLASKTVQGSGGNVQIRVGGRENKDQDTRVNNVRKSSDLLHCNHERRGGSGALSLGSESQILRVVRDQHTNEEHTENIKYNDSPEGQFDGLRDRLSRVLSFSDCHANKFGT